MEIRERLSIANVAIGHIKERATRRYPIAAGKADAVQRSYQIAHEAGTYEAIISSLARNVPGVAEYLRDNMQAFKS